MSEGHGSRRAWGWYPLADAWAGRIVADAHIHPGELVVDIGAGLGTLTTQLLAAGARVLAVEPHPGRAERLTETFAGRPVTVIRTDACSMRWPARPFRVVANPPYAITTELLRLLLSPRSRLVAADLVLQRAVVNRYAGSRVHRWQLRAGRSVPRSAFRPVPRVDSAVLVIRKH